jgi:peptidoglycan hydrolase-like protein with peptidoglycan-binding domain
LAEPSGHGRDGQQERTASTPLARAPTAPAAAQALLLQRLVGNQATARILQRDEAPTAATAPAGPAQPTTTPPEAGVPLLLANPYIGEHDPVTLGNTRFQGIRALERIAGGEGELSRADNGPAVQAVQQALVDLGYRLLLHHQDGRFGDETADAIGQFRTDRGMDAGGLTARALRELDRDAPPPGQQEEHFLDYERLFQDDRLDVAFAVGFDEGQSHQRDLEDTRRGLLDRGFTELYANIEGTRMEYVKRTEVSFPGATGARQTKTISVVANIISPGAGAAAEFGAALADSELAIYVGHARMGIGPDFDPDTDPAENFVIGINSALHAAGRATDAGTVARHHYVVDRVNDLEAMTAAGRFDQERYRVWFFNACRSIAYLDEIRGGILPESVNRSSLDVFATTRSIPILSGTGPSFAMLDGVLQAQTMEEIVRMMERYSRDVVSQRLAELTNLTEARRRRIATEADADLIGGFVAEGGGGNLPAAR